MESRLKVVWNWMSSTLHFWLMAAIPDSLVGEGQEWREHAGQLGRKRDM